MPSVRYAVESSVLVAALAKQEAHLEACSALIGSPCFLYLHGLSETSAR